MPTPSVFPITESNLGDSSRFDAVLCITSKPAAVTVCGSESIVAAHAAVDAKFGSSITVLPVPTAAGGRLIIAPTGALMDDFDDPRCIAAAGREGALRAKAAGARRIAVAVTAELVTLGGPYEHAVLVALLGVLEGLYVALQARDALGEEEESVREVGLAALNGADVSETVRVALATEAGRRLAREVGGADVERMGPRAIAAHVQAALAGMEGVTVTVEADVDRIRANYPLAAAVARASMGVPRHAPVVIRLEYRPAGEIRQQLFVAGKGVAFDTGGVNVKAASSAGMSRDKCGAAAAAGLVRAFAALRAPDVRVVAMLGVVVNAVGPEAYLPDEIVRGHSGRRVLVTHTDAEGRMVLADMLSSLREEAVASVADPALKHASITMCSIATLTGHVGLAWGPYTAAMENGPAAAHGLARALQHAGTLLADPLEVSSLRREDFAVVAAHTPDHDVVQSVVHLPRPVKRGHQYPAAFLLRASALDVHGTRAELPLPYVHLDIAASAVAGRVGAGYETAAPVAALLARFGLGL